MALNFPDNPGIGSVFVDTNSGFSFKWDGTVWNGFAGSSASEISNLDNIAGSFNGSTTTFALAKDSASVSPLSAVQLRVVLGGVTQTAGTDYTISGSGNIIFTTAPLAGLTCTITQLGVALSLADPANGSVTPAKLSTGGPKWNSSGDFYISGIATANNGLVVGVGLTLADDVKINLGDDNDLQIVHDGSNSLIDGAGTGGVHLKSNTEIKFLKRTGSENILVGTADGSVAAFYDNTKRLETTTGGALVYGTVGAAQTALVVEGDIKATGVVTAVSFNGDLVGTAATTNSTGLHVVGVATVLNVNATNVTAGVVTATTFSGALSGNATSATTATTATNVTVADESSDTSCNVLFTTAATGDLAPKSGTNLTFNSSSGALTATSFVGDLTGNVTGNATGLSGTPNIDCGTGSFTGDIDIADKIVHTGDTNTAIRFPSTDTITLETSGSERLRITSAGNIGINSTSPGFPLVVQADGNRNSIQIINAGSGTEEGRLYWYASDASTIRGAISGQENGLLFFAGGATERARIDSSGDMGLGVTPNNFGSQRTFHIKGPSGEGAAIRLQDNGDTADSNDYIIYKNASAAYLRVNGTDPLRFYLNGAERMQLDSSGRLSIANDIPGSFTGNGSDNLVVGSGSGNEGITIYSGSSNTGALSFGDGTSGDAAYRGGVEYNHSTDKLQFRAGGVANRVTISNAGFIDAAGGAEFGGIIYAQAGAVAEIGTLTSGSTVTPDFATHCNFTLTLGTNVTLANPSNVIAGQSGSIFLVQDGTGSRTISFGSYYDFAGGTAPTLSTAASSVDRLDYFVRTSSSIHCVVTLAYS